MAIAAKSLRDIPLPHFAASALPGQEDKIVISLLRFGFQMFAIRFSQSSAENSFELRSDELKTKTLIRVG